MLSFTQKKAHPNLRNYIRGYWLLESTSLEEPLDLLVPDGYPELFFVLNESLKMQQFSGEKSWAQPTEGGLIGQATQQFTFQISAFSKILFVKCYPWTPHQLFGIPSWQLNDRAIELGAITHDTDFRRLSEQVCNSKNLQDTIMLLDAFFLKKLVNIDEKNPFIRFAVQKMYSSDGTISMDSLTRYVHASNRYVQKIFKEKVGMSPKQYAQMIRVKKASMYLIDPRFKGNLREIANRLEYYDQSHLLKDFKAVMGQSPSMYLQRKISLSENELMSYLDQWDYS